jgi:1-aminocyclopropane-1-carboxylate deaminase/D-cysteine desulfhydrase-like pyridoxal-dependent ACC family enzyme
MDFSKILYEVTPVERHGNLFFKRDDLFEFEGMRGGKVRAALALCIAAKEQGYTMVVSACSRHSPQLAILGAIGWELGLFVVGFVAEGADTLVMRQAIGSGVHINKVKAGYSVVVQARAREYASEHGGFLVPFGMKGPDSIRLTEHQAEQVFAGSESEKYKRVVMVAGSGVNMSGVLQAMGSWGKTHPVVGVLVGHDCRSYVEANKGEFKGKISFVVSPVPYHDNAIYSSVNGVEVDSRYEGKAIPFLLPGDLFWLVGFVGSNTVPVERVV